MKKLSFIAAGLLLSAGILAFAANTNMSDKQQSKNAACQGACDKSSCDKSCDLSSCPPGCPPCK